MYIDVGATSREDCPVKVGDIAAFERSFIEMGDRLVAKSLDDRAGVVVLIETLRGSPFDMLTVHAERFVFCLHGAGGSWHRAA